MKPDATAPLSGPHDPSGHLYPAYSLAVLFTDVFSTRSYWVDHFTGNYVINVMLARYGRATRTCMKALSMCGGTWQALCWRSIVHALFSLVAFSLLEARDTGLHGVVQ